MKLVNSVVFFILICFSAFSQVEKFKSIDKNVGEVTREIDRLNKKAKQIFLTNPDSAHSLASSALIMAEKLNDSMRMGRSFLNLGVIYWSQSYYPVSLFYLKSSLNYFPAKAFPDHSEAFKSLGRSYADLGKYKEAFINLDLGLKYAGNDPESKAEIFSERAYVYTLQNKFKEALNNAEISIKLNKANNLLRNVAITCSRFAVIYRKMGLYKKALPYIDTTLDLAIKTQNKRLQAFAYVQYAELYNSMGSYDKGIYYAHKAIEQSIKVGVLDFQKLGFDEIVKSYEQKNQLKEAIFFQKKYNRLKDSINNVSKLNTITLVQNYYDLNSKMNGLAVLKATQKSDNAKILYQKQLIRLLFILVIFLVVILIGTYYFYRQKQLLSKELQIQHEALLQQKQLIEVQTINMKAVNDLKDKLITVIGHDLRAPISNLSAIIELFETDQVNAEEVHELMKTINPIVKGAELTLLNLMEWASSQLKGKNVQSSQVDLFILGLEMEQTFKHALKVKKITFFNDTKPGEEVYADNNHLKVILRNLISNAIKFTDVSGAVTLKSIIENDDILISITDTGRGMNAEEIEKLFNMNLHFSKTGTLGEKGTGIGLLLVKELVELNGSKLGVKSSPGNGSTFYFKLPIVKINTAY